MDGNDAFVSMTTKLKADAIILAVFVLVIWSVRLLDGLFLKGKLKTNYAIQPRKRFKASAILVSPFVHLNNSHLLGNTIYLFFMGLLVMLPETRFIWLVTAVTILIGGLGIWLFGAGNTAHIGASGLVMGYFGFVLARGFFDRDTGQILFALAVAMFYAGLFRQIIPLRQGISTTGHLFGFLGGVLAAWLPVQFPGMWS